MHIIRYFLLICLFLISVNFLIALEVITETTHSDNTIMVSCRVKGIDVEEIINILEDGESLRINWFFRGEGSEMLIMKFIRKDSLSDTYNVYDSGWNHLIGPLDLQSFIEVISTLDNQSLSFFGEWPVDANYEVCFLIDRETALMAIPLDVFGERSINRSPWTLITRPEGAEQ